MRSLLPLALILAAPVWAETQEDAAHRADRLRTQALNQRAATAVSNPTSGNAAAQARYREALAQYERQLADWRARVAACEGGDWRACD